MNAELQPARDAGAGTTPSGAVDARAAAGTLLRAGLLPAVVVDTLVVLAAILAGAFAWLAGQVRATAKLRVLTYGDRVSPG